MDLLAWPVIGSFLKWRHARTALQAPLLAAAALILFDGLAGPQLAPKNLATVAVWLHYRGLVVLALLLAGNLFCMACPFMLPRQAARWLRERLGGGRVLPARLRTKWPAVALVVLFFYCYEQFDLWATPWWTAWLVAAYFVVAFAVDAVFRGASFCKHICPVGQFNFFGSLVSPLEIRVRQQAACTACRSKDCIRGNQRARGCELWLFQERKSGNMDCTFCLDCVHACPFDNVGLQARPPTAELWHDRFRSGIGRFSRRTDLAVLVAVFIFGAYLNAFAMIRPVYQVQAALERGLAAAGLGRGAGAAGLAVIYLLGLVVLPAALLALAGLACRAASGRRSQPLARTIRRYVYSLAPVGFGMWLAHYAFHFLTGALTVVPVVQSFLADVGLYAGRPDWSLGPLVPPAWLFPIEAALLYLGAFGSLIAAFRIAAQEIEDGGGRAPAAVPAAAAPWMALTLLLLALGLWILVQPMEMRGTMLFPGAAP